MDNKTHFETQWRRETTADCQRHNNFSCPLRVWVAPHLPQSWTKTMTTAVIQHERSGKKPRWLPGDIFFKCHSMSVKEHFYEMDKRKRYSVACSVTTQSLEEIRVAFNKLPSFY